MNENALKLAAVFHELFVLMAKTNKSQCVFLALLFCLFFYEFYILTYSGHPSSLLLCTL